MISIEDMEFKDKKEKGFFTKMFCDKNEPSSKRVVGIVGSFTLFITLIAHTFTDVCNPPSDVLVNSVALLSFGALGITGVEKIFSKK